MTKPKKLQQGRGSWAEPKSRSIWPLKTNERILFRDYHTFRGMLRNTFFPGYKEAGYKLTKKDEMFVENTLVHYRREFRKRSNAILGQTIEFMNYIFRFSHARGELFPEEDILLTLLKSVIWAYLQKHYHKPWEEMSAERLQELEERADNLTFELTSKIKWPNHPWLYSSK